MTNRFEFITKEATAATQSKNRVEFIWFHYFNQNGIVAKLDAAQGLVDLLVDQRLARGGAILAYGSFNHYYRDRLAKLSHQRKPKWMDINITIAGIERDIAAAHKFFGEVI